MEVEKVNRLYFASDIDIDFIDIEKEVQEYDSNIFIHPKITRNTRLFNDYGSRYNDTTPYMSKTDRRVEAYYFDVEKQGVIKFDIYKKTPEQKYYTYVYTINSYKLYDYNIESGQYYHYLATVNEADGTVSTYSMINEQTGEDEYYRRTFGNWTICNVEEDFENENVYIKTGKTWNLGYNIDTPSFNQSLSVTSWDTLGRYPKVSIGERNYDTSRFTGLLGLIKEYTSYDFVGQNNYQQIIPMVLNDYTEKNETFNNSKYENYEIDLADNYKYACEVWTVTNKYATEMDKLKAWKEFMSDGELKLLRDNKGNTWIIQISEPPEYSINYISNRQQTQISFTWKEVINASNISIVNINNLSEMED